VFLFFFFFFFSSRSRHTRFSRDWSSDVCSSDRWDAAYVDSMGNLIASFGRQKPGPRAMIAAHMDEVGLIVDFIDDDGFLRFKKVGGIDDRVLPAARVRVG